MLTRHCVKILLLLLLPYNPLQAQIYASYSTESKSLLANMKAGIEGRFVTDSIATTGENKKYILRHLRDRRNFLINLFNEDMIVSSPDANNYFKKIVNEIIVQNPFLQTATPRAMLYRAWWPNAFSAGEGTIMVNLGLFNKLANESQLAFILCHELAHLYLDHSNQAILAYVNTVYADDFQQELKKIKKSSYQQNKQLDELEKTVTFTSRRHGRLHETEADSMAIALMSKTRFDVRESITTLHLLDKIDSSEYDMETLLKNSFNFTQYPFKESWIKKESVFFGGAEREKLPVADSLKTHPDCQKRIAFLQPLVNKLKGSDQLSPINKTSFTSQKDSLQLEVIETLIKSKDISRALYHALVLQTKKPGDAYLLGATARCLNKIFENQKQHTLGKIADRPSPYHAKDYNTLVKFLEPLRLEEVAAIAYYFMLNNKEAAKGDMVFEKAFIESTTNFNQTLTNK